MTKPISTPNSLNILFVEDNAIARHTGLTLFKNAGCTLHLAENAEEALVMFKNISIDAVISDLGLPGMQGDEMTSILRYWEKISNKPSIPIFALTAHADERIKNYCLIAGMDQIFMKPLDDVSVANILTQLNNYKIQKNFTQQEMICNKAIAILGPDLPDSEEKLFCLEEYPIFDYADSMAKAGIESNLKEMLELTINKVLPEELVNLKTAYAQENWERIRELAHKIKGGSLYCGTIKMTYACQYMERYYKAGHRKLLERLYLQLITVLEETDKVIRPIICKLNQNAF